MLAHVSVGFLLNDAFWEAFLEEDFLFISTTLLASKSAEMLEEKKMMNFSFKCLQINCNDLNPN